MPGFTQKTPLRYLKLLHQSGGPLGASEVLWDDGDGEVLLRSRWRRRRRGSGVRAAEEDLFGDVRGGLEDQGGLGGQTHATGPSALGGLVAALGEVDLWFHLGEVWRTEAWRLSPVTQKRNTIEMMTSIQHLAVMKKTNARKFYLFWTHG